MEIRLKLSHVIAWLWNIGNISLKFRQLITVEVQFFATSDIWKCGMCSLSQVVTHGHQIHLLLWRSWDIWHCRVCSLSHMVTWSSNSLITVEALRHLTFQGVFFITHGHMVTVWRGALAFRVSVIRTTIAGSISFYKIIKIIQYFTEQTLKGCSWKRPDGEDYWW